ncbi:MAG TPA: hypothetical protein VN035_10635 [Microbacterium sp.]|nr:hypothetical protein [Microbacterium sp.]
MDARRFHITAADELLTENAMALLVGMLLDQQVHQPLTARRSTT